MKCIRDIEGELNDKLVLVRLDLEIASVTSKDNEINHYKFRRAAKTINLLLQCSTKIIISYSQGTVRLDIQKNGYNFPNKHVQMLLQNIPYDKEYKNINNENDLSSFLESNYKLGFLPNLITIFPQEKYAKFEISSDYCGESSFFEKIRKSIDIFVLDDFRNCIKSLPSNLGLLGFANSFVGLGLYEDIFNLEAMISKCIDFGKKSKKRVAICGSLRPYDLNIIEVLLQNKLFDVILLGPIPSLAFAIAKGKNINASMKEKLISMANSKGKSLDVITTDICEKVLRTYSNSVVMPMDYYIQQANHLSEISSGEINEEYDIVGIGSRTIAKYQNICANADLVFHFGMLSSSEEKFRFITEAIIKGYGSNNNISYTAGDHITMLAEGLGFNESNTTFITGAQTTANFLAGENLIGLANYLKSKD